MLQLFRREQCALCELAIEALRGADVPAYQERYLEDDAEAEVRYGFRIPVLQREDGAELDWPFDARRIRDFLRAPSDPRPSAAG
jgi:Glutaredoxin-like domain (DUF836)